MESKSQPKPEEKGQNPVIKAYLVAYNVAQMLGWTVLGVIMVNHFITEKTVEKLYPKVDKLLQICQTAAILEILHAMTGLVRSNWVLTAFQVYSRVFLVWGIVWSCPPTQGGLAVCLWLGAWTLTEVVRYSFYFFSLLPGPVPSVLVWCRYTFFLILYPIGVTGELMSILAALPYVKQKQLYSLDLPNQYNVAFNYHTYLCVIMASYLPVFPQLYFHMIGQRKKVLGPKRVTAEKKSN